MSEPINLPQIFSFLSKTRSLEPQNLDLTLRYFKVPFMSSLRLSVEEREQCCQELLRLVTKSNDVRLTLTQFSQAAKSYIVFKRLAEAVSDSLNDRAATEMDLSKIYPDTADYSTQDSLSQDATLMPKRGWGAMWKSKFVRTFLCLK
jgi:hypothetical protein